jgi:hypothetical protein
LHLRFRAGYTPCVDYSGAFRGFDWERAEDITVLSEGALRGRLEALSVEEKAAGYRQMVLQGRIDLIRAELVKRGVAALPPEDLARVFVGAWPDGEHL